MIAERQTLIQSADLALELGISIKTLCRWAHTDPSFKRSKFKRGWYSIQKLRDHGICVSSSTVNA